MLLIKQIHGIKSFFVLLAIFCQASYVFSQQPSLFFERITVQNGLSHNKVNCILQDHRGFMWIGTDDGLNRFDGHNFSVYRNEPEDSTTVSGNIITGLLEDENKIIWIATGDGGLTRYDFRLPPDKQFKQYKHKITDSSSIPNNIINAMVEDENKNLWLATSGSNLLRFNKKTEKFERTVPGSGRTFLTLCFDASGYIWTGGHGGGIFKINPQTLHHFRDERYTNLYAGLPHMEVSSLYRDEQNDIWLGSWDKVLYRYKNKTGIETIYRNAGNGNDFTEDDILCFAKDNNGFLWMGGHYNGLQLYDPKTGKFYLYQYNPAKEGSIADNRINCLYQDKSGMMWAGTNKGLSVSNPAQQQFQQIFLPAINNEPSPVHAIHEEDGNLWIGSANGIFIKRKGSSTFIHQPLSYKGEPLTVTSFFKDGNTIYLGTNYSLFVFDPKNNAVKLLPNTEQDRVMSRIIDSRIVSILKDTIDGNPVLLVSPYGHFFAYYDLAEKHWISRLDSTKDIISNFGIRDNLIHKFLKQENGKIWLANVTKGLGEWNKNTDKIIYHTNNPSQGKGLSNNHIYDIAEDKKGNLWISTFGGGLHFRDKTTGTISHINGSPNLLEGLQTDNEGNVWMIASGELFRYSPAQQVFTSINLPDLEKTGGVKGYLFKDASGKLYASGLNYFFAFDPSQIQLQRTISPVQFTDFKIFDRSFSHLLTGEKITLPYDQNSISISFAAPDFSFAAPLRFAYMMEGIDKTWIQAGSDNTTNYPNLGGKTYVFKIKILNHPSEAGKETVLYISVIPPFWQRWWFYALCAVATALLIYFIYKYRIEQLHKQQAIRNKIAQDLHDNMGSALSSISVYTQVAKIHNTRYETEKLEDILQKMSETSNDVISEMNDIVWAINPRNDSMEKILQRMESFAKPLAAAKGIRMEFDQDTRISSLNMEMEKRKNFYLVFREAFNNAIKYADAKNIHVTIRQDHRNIVLEIKDDGKGFDVERKLAGTTGTSSMGGNGLRNMQMRAKEMKGECSLISSGGKGTLVILRFPV